MTIKFTTLSIGKGGLKGANAWYKRMILTSAKGVGGIGQKEEKGEKESAVVSGQSVAVGSITGEGKRAKGRRGDGETGAKKKTWSVVSHSWQKNKWSVAICSITGGGEGERGARKKM